MRHSSILLFPLESLDSVHSYSSPSMKVFLKFSFNYHGTIIECCKVNVCSDETNTRNDMAIISVLFETCIGSHLHIGSNQLAFNSRGTCSFRICTASSKITIELVVCPQPNSNTRIKQECVSFICHRSNVGEIVRYIRKL